jgi:hypothetical protein
MGTNDVERVVLWGPPDGRQGGGVEDAGVWMDRTRLGGTWWKLEGDPHRVDPFGGAWGGPDEAPEGTVSRQHRVLGEVEPIDDTDDELAARDGPRFFEGHPDSEVLATFGVSGEGTSIFTSDDDGRVEHGFGGDAIDIEGAERSSDHLNAEGMFDACLGGPVDAEAHLVRRQMGFLPSVRQSGAKGDGHHGHGPRHDGAPVRHLAVVLNR